MVIWVSENEVTTLQHAFTSWNITSKDCFGIKDFMDIKIWFWNNNVLSFCLSPLLMCVLKCLQNISLKGAFTSDVVLNTKLRLFEDTSWQIGTIYADKLCKTLQRNCRNWEDKYTKKTETQIIVCWHKLTNCARDCPAHIPSLRNAFKHDSFGHHWILLVIWVTNCSITQLQKIDALKNVH